MTYDGGRGKLIHSTAPGLLTGKPADAFDDSHAIMTETGAVDCVSVNQEPLLARVYGAAGCVYCVADDEGASFCV